ncbi:MAG: UPF0280 family protein [Rhodobacteraceae bacterium]|nr:UPF0280 family protein [Paracoccaceae bacterium]
MTAGPQSTLLSGDRLHLHHGPIDLVIGVDGPERAQCFAAAIARFQTVLSELITELPDLRRPLQPDMQFRTPIARRMARAVGAHEGRAVFVTPMAAVAGAVADDVLAAMLQKHRPEKAYVNNGGDIAFHISGKAVFDVVGPAGRISVGSDDPVRGIATSGWRGRSHSLGIADAATVLARHAAGADVAATLIANSVDLPDHPGITRCPANTLNPDSDLGHRLVTTHVAPLDLNSVHRALDAGQRVAEQMIERGLAESAVLSCQGRTRTPNAPAYVRE